MSKLGPSVEFHCHNFSTHGWLPKKSILRKDFRIRKIAYLIIKGKFPYYFGVDPIYHHKNQVLGGEICLMILLNYVSLNVKPILPPSGNLRHLLNMLSKLQTTNVQDNKN